MIGVSEEMVGAAAAAAAAAGMGVPLGRVMPAPPDLEAIHVVVLWYGGVQKRREERGKRALVHPLVYCCYKQILWLSGSEED